jgi:hypothetical protein
LKDYSYTLDSAKVWVQDNFGKWNIDTYGINHINKVGIGAVSDNSFMLNVTARPNTTALMIKGYNDSYNQISGYSGDGTNNFSVYNNGGIYSKTSLKVGENGKTITRTGSIAEKDIWTGTQAEYDLLTPVGTTLYFIHNGNGIFGIIFLLLLSFGSKAQNWSSVKVGSTDVNRIYKGGDIIWEKPSIPTGGFTMATTSTSSTWSPQSVTNTGAILHWSVTGVVNYEVDANKPIFNFSTPGTKYITVTNADNFSNVTIFQCISNQLTSLNVSGLSNLTDLYCYSNQLTSLNVSGLSNLTYLYCYSNQLTSLDVSGLSNLIYLRCYSNQLTSLNVSGLSKLTYLYCYSNQLTSLNVSGLSNLTYLRCYSNQLTSLNVSGLSKLTQLYCQTNQLTSLNVSGLSNLTQLNCYSNQLTSLNVSGLSNLTQLNCYSNQLTTSAINIILDQLIAINNISGSQLDARSQVGGGCGDTAKIAALDAIWDRVYITPCN